MSDDKKTTNDNPSRRDFLGVAWAFSGMVALTGGAGMTVAFLSPRVGDGEFGGVFDLGPASDFPNGSVTPVTGGRFYLVRQDDGGFLALYQKCTHLGCAVPWEPEAGQFICPCHASAFERDGQVLNPPAPRPLDRFPVTFEDGMVRVDTGTTITRDRTAPTDAVYVDEV